MTEEHYHLTTTDEAREARLEALERRASRLEEQAQLHDEAKRTLAKSGLELHEGSAAQAERVDRAMVRLEAMGQRLAQWQAVVERLEVHAREVDAFRASFGGGAAGAQLRELFARTSSQEERCGRLSAALQKVERWSEEHGEQQPKLLKALEEYIDGVRTELTRRIDGLEQVATNHAQAIAAATPTHFVREREDLVEQLRLRDIKVHQLEQQLAREQEASGLEIAELRDVLSRVEVLANAVLATT